MKLFIASLLVFSLVILFLFALFPTDITVSRVVQINRSSAEVLRKIDDLREWKSWNELLVNGLDNMKKVNAPVKIDSSHIQKGFFMIDLLKVVPDTVTTVWHQEEKSFTGNYFLSGADQQTVVEWTLQFHIHWYPWDKLASMFYDKNLGPGMEKSLMNLKNELESPVH